MCCPDSGDALAEPLNVLILHALGDFSRARQTSLHHLFCLPRYQPQNRYVLHDVADPVTPALRALRFHAIVLDVTFLCMRYLRPRALFEAIVEKYFFVGASDAFRLAMPQDEYDHSEILDEWLAAWGTDLIFSVLPRDWDLLYARTKRRARLRPALTGYVDDQDAALVSRLVRPFAERSLDVGYRARELPPQFGRHGRMKSELGRRFAAVAEGRGLRLDLSTRPDDVVVGDKWLAFLADCRHTLGSEGGSSVLDPRGEVRDRVETYLAGHPGAPFAEVEAACFPGLDGVRFFSAISPRLFEAAMVRTSQVLVRAPYLPEIRPDEDYIQLEPDLSNVSEVLDAMGDVARCERRAAACYEALIRPPTYRYSRFAGEVAEAMRSGAREKAVRGTDPARFAELARGHEAEVRWTRRRAKAWTWALERARPLRHLLPRGIRGAARGALRGLAGRS